MKPKVMKRADGCWCVVAAAGYIHLAFMYWQDAVDCALRFANAETNYLEFLEKIS